MRISMENIPSKMFEGILHPVSCLVCMVLQSVTINTKGVTTSK